MRCGRLLAGQVSVRSVGRALLLLVVFTHLQSAAAQQAEPMSPSVVLVLKLVSKTLVKPTTGVVVSDDGMVLVPASFAAEAGEMIVLDGGTDIASNGRPAKLVDGGNDGDLALLSVRGLKRPGISFSGNLADTAGALHLEAFPPAEDIAKGAPPIRLPARIQLNSQTSQGAIPTETPLPYVTGAILDACGHLAGVSLAGSPQSMDSSKATSILFGADLRRLLESMQVELPEANCERKPESTIASVAASAEHGQAASIAGPTEPAAPASRQDDVEITTDEPGDIPIAERPGQATVGAKPEQETVNRAVEPPSIWRHVPAWLVVLVIIAAGFLAWKIIYFLRLKPHPHGNTDRSVRPAAVQPASDEPVTAPLADHDESPPLKPRSAPVPNLEIPETASRPDGCDGLLLVEGMLDGETPFRRFCFVDTGRMDVVIGRGDADIVIEHAAISRNHARVRSEGEHLTLSDLGSRNGSFIGDVPCLAGEVMYLDAGTEIFLGDVKITINVVNQEAEWA